MTRQASGPRQPGAVNVEGNARRLVRSIERHVRIAAHHREQAEAESEGLVAYVRDIERRLGIDLRGVDDDDGWLYDILNCVTVDPSRARPGTPRRDMPWRWNGPRSHHGTPICRRPRGTGGGEISAVRYIAIRLGRIPEDFQGQLYPPAIDPEDVNPWHRHPTRKHQEA